MDKNIDIIYMSNLNSQLQSLAESYNNDISQHLETLANSKAQDLADKANDIVSKATGIENMGQLIGGTTTAVRTGVESYGKVRDIANKFKKPATKSENPADVETNASKSSEGRELTDFASKEGLEEGGEAAEIGGSLLGELAVPGIGLFLDVATLATLGVTTAIGLSKKHKEKVAEQKYKNAVSQANDIQNQAHTISSIVQTTGQKASGGITSLD
jgi:hypothetical protein